MKLLKKIYLSFCLLLVKIRNRFFPPLPVPVNECNHCCREYPWDMFPLEDGHNSLKTFTDVPAYYENPLNGEIKFAGYFEVNFHICSFCFNKNIKISKVIFKNGNTPQPIWIDDKGIEYECDEIPQNAVLLDEPEISVSRIDEIIEEDDLDEDDEYFDEDDENLLS